MAMSRGVHKAVEVCIEQLGKMATPVKSNDKKAIATVAMIAGNNDPEIGEILADALMKVGNDGVITVEEGRQINTEVDLVEGMQFERGYLSPHFVTDEDEQVCELENCRVLIWEEKISNAKDLVPLLESISESGQPLLIIAEDVEGEALATLVVNKLRGILKIAAVKAPGYGDRRKAQLEDIAVLTGGQAIFKDLGIKLENVTVDQPGHRRQDHHRRREHHGPSRAPAIRPRSTARVRANPAGDRKVTESSDYDRREAPGATGQVRRRCRPDQRRGRHRDEP